MKGDTYPSSTLLELSGHIEYGVIDVIGHRLGITPTLEHLQATATRKTIHNVILGQIKVAVEKSKIKPDDILASTGLIRQMVKAQNKTTKKIVRIDIGLDWETFEKLLDKAMEDDKLVEAISNVLQGQETTEADQKQPAISLPHEDLVNRCADSIVQSRLLEKFITVCGESRDPELEMYEPLAKIFSKIQRANPADRPAKISRTIVRSETSKSFRHDDHNLDDFERKPDFSILDIDKMAGLKRPPFYRQMASFVEVKGKETDGPTSSLANFKDKQVTNQFVDYASLIMTARPFNVFSIGLIVHGTKFTVMYADRAGICFSPEYGFEEHFRLFVCIVMRLTFYMSDYDIGQDPTVTIAKGSYHSQEYPEFVVEMRNSPREVRVWSTYGHPLFVSRSVFGRGSSTWKAVSFDKQHCVLKCAWRSKARLHTESSIYNRIGPHPGVAHWLDGDDARAGTNPLSTSFLRGRVVEKLDCQLYRVAIQPIGKPLWESATALEILLGFRSAIKGHQYMFEEKGILHRDISAGNILLCDDKHPADSHVRFGFLMDPELALVINSDAPTIAVEVNPPKNRTSVLPLAQGKQLIFQDGVPGPKTAGAPITGTAQFMAVEVLKAIRSGVSNYPRKAHHDLESFTWVFHYALFMRTFKSLGNHNVELYAEFRAVFGALDLPSMILARTSHDAMFPALSHALLSEREVGLYEVHRQFVELRQKQLPQPRFIRGESLAHLARPISEVKTAVDTVNVMRPLVDVPPSVSDLLTYEKLLTVLNSVIDPTG